MGRRKSESTQHREYMDSLRNKLNLMYERVVRIDDFFIITRGKAQQLVCPLGNGVINTSEPFEQIQFSVEGGGYVHRLDKHEDQRRIFQVKANGRYGIIDRTGRNIVPVIYTNEVRAYGMSKGIIVTGRRDIRGIDGNYVGDEINVYFENGNRMFSVGAGQQVTFYKDELRIDTMRKAERYSYEIDTSLVYKYGETNPILRLTGREVRNLKYGYNLSKTNYNLAQMNLQFEDAINIRWVDKLSWGREK